MSHHPSAPRRRLLTLTPDFPPSIGGIQALYEQTLAHLPEWDHHVVTRRAEGATHEAWIERSRLLAGKPAFVELNARAVSAALRLRPDVVLAGHVNFAPAAAVIKRLRIAPIVGVLLADELGAFPRMTRGLLRHSDVAWAVSTFTRHLARTIAPDGCPIEVIHPGVEPVGPEPQGTRSERPTILTVSRLTERYKGHDVTLDAIARLRDHIPDVLWVIVGDGPLRPELEEKASRLGIRGSHVQFVGAVSDAERDAWFGRAHLFTMMSRIRDEAPGGEGFGIVYLEAGRFGLPSVAGDCGGALDAVLHNESGLLVDPTDPDVIADAFQTVLGDPMVWARLSAGARRNAAEHTHQGSADQVARLLGSVL